MVVLRSLLPINEIAALLGFLFASVKYILFNGIIVLVVFSAYLVTGSPKIATHMKLRLLTIKAVLLLVYLLSTFNTPGLVLTNSILQQSDRINQLPKYITHHPSYEVKFYKSSDRRLETTFSSQKWQRVTVVTTPDLQKAFTAVLSYTKNKPHFRVHNFVFANRPEDYKNIESTFRQLRAEIQSYLTMNNVVMTFREVPKELMEAGFAELLYLMSQSDFQVHFIIFESRKDIAVKVFGSLIRKASLHRKSQFRRFGC